MPTRRRTVAVVGSALLAGCTFGGGSSEGETTRGTTTTADTTTATTTTTTTTETTTAETTTTTTTTEGCGKGKPDLIVDNESDSEAGVFLEVRHSSSEQTVLDTSVTLGIGDTKSWGNRVRKGGSYRVTVQIPDGPADIYSWQVPESEIECDHSGLTITITEDGLSYTER